MIKLKQKIKTINSLPETKKEKMSIITILSSIIALLVILILIFLAIEKTIPYITATDINKITGKKIFITKCNTKDYLIISKDKSYSLSLTDNNCKTHNYEGTLKIKNNEIIFNKKINGIIDNNYNIIINNNLFESDKNE